MPYDVTRGFQLSSLPSFEPVLDVPWAYPYRVGGAVVGAAQYEAAANFEGHSSLDYEPKEWQYSAGTVSISSGVATLTGGEWPHWTSGQQFFVGGEIYTVATKNSSTVLTLTDTSVNAPAATPYLLREGRFRETDPSLTNMSAIAYAQWEYADAIMEVAQRARDVGAEIGIYAELLTHQHTRIQHVLDNPGGENLFRNWRRDLEVTANLKCWNGLSLIDIVNSFGGKIYFPAYVPSEFTSSTHNKNRFRRLVRRVAAALRDQGAQPVPLFMPNTLQHHDTWVATGARNRTPADILQGMVDDMEHDQPGEWGVWGVQRNNDTENEADSTFIADLTG